METNSSSVKRLSDFQTGMRAIIVRINGGKGIRQRLTDMGFVPGEEIEILNKETEGPMLISLKNSKVAIGKIMADEIIARPFSGKSGKYHYKTKKIVIALAGNPNSGKSTIFNHLSGARQHVGNYPGVTVEKKEGFASIRGFEIKFVDLPGTYGLSAYSVEELIARKFVLENKPDVIINVVDASNLERNLYLTTQFMELQIPMVIALNKMDIAREKGLSIDIKHLSELLNIPIVATQGDKKKGISELINIAVDTAENPVKHIYPLLNYGSELNHELEKIQNIISRIPQLCEKFPPRWVSLKLLENDEDVVKTVKNYPDAYAVFDEAGKSISNLHAIFQDSPEVIIADRRYGFISGACSESMKMTSEIRHDFSDMIDKILLNRMIGLPIFIILMWLTFSFVFTIGDPLVQLIDGFFSLLSGFFSSVIPSETIKSLIVDGIISGVGGVLVFLPNIMLLFIAIAILEDTGYMARAAFVIDKIMHKIGLHGKSFIPMLIGFGCTVPAILSTRILESKRDRIVTILILPLISCGARLPVYILLTGAFFSDELAPNILISIYLLGLVLAIVMAKLFRKFLFTGDSVPMVMELPPYRIPTMNAIFIHTWQRSWMYIKKAGTIILLFAIAVWFVTTYPKHYPEEAEIMIKKENLRQKFYGEIMPIAQKYSVAPQKLVSTEPFFEVYKKVKTIESEFDEKIRNNEINTVEEYRKWDKLKESQLKRIFIEYPQVYHDVLNYTVFEKEFNQDFDKIEAKEHSYIMINSYAGKLGKIIEPVLKPLGFDWRIGIALITGFAAKELVVSTLSTILSVSKTAGDNHDLKNAIRSDPVFNPLTAYALMVFILIYIPCMASMITVWKETGSAGLTWFMILYTSSLAWIITFIVYQGGLLLGLGG